MKYTYMLSSIILCALCTSCGSVNNQAKYFSSLDSCMKASSCEEYVACRSKVAEQYGRDFKGNCGVKQ